jgi:hypothetical protein
MNKFGITSLLLYKYRAEIVYGVHSIVLIRREADTASMALLLFDNVLNISAKPPDNPDEIIRIFRLLTITLVMFEFSRNNPLILTKMEMTLNRVNRLISLLKTRIRILREHVLDETELNALF